MRRIAWLVAGVVLTTAVLLPLPASAAPAPPAVPRVSISNTSLGTYLSWTAGGATEFRIQQATDARFTRDVRQYTDRDGRDRQFTPPALSKGTTYFWRVRGVNGSTAGRYSATVRATVAADVQKVRVLTYNILVSTQDGATYGSEPVAPWSKRAVAVAGLIEESRASLVAIQEGGGWVNEVKGPRQVDDLITRLGGTYALAYTEPVPGTVRGWFRSSRHILYRPSVYAPVGGGGRWTIGTDRWAAYQVFRHKASGAMVLFTSYHLSSAPGTTTGDKQRTAETGSLIAQARALSAQYGKIPVIYAGDANSHDGSNHVFDGPGRVTRGHRIADAFKSAAKRVNAHINSGNAYQRTLRQSGRSIDRVFAPPGVGIRGWQLLANMAGGRLTGTIPSDHNPVQVDLTVPVVRFS